MVRRTAVRRYSASREDYFVSRNRRFFWLGATHCSASLLLLLFEVFPCAMLAWLFMVRRTAVRRYPASHEAHTLYLTLHPSPLFSQFNPERRAFTCLAPFHVNPSIVVLLNDALDQRKA